MHHTITAQLICAFGFAYVDCWHSGAEAYVLKSPAKLIMENLICYQAEIVTISFYVG